jgi:hypothetical protein
LAIAILSNRNQEKEQEARIGQVDVVMQRRRWVNGLVLFIHYG